MPFKFLDLSQNKLIGPLTNLPNIGKFDVFGYGFYPGLFLQDNLFNGSIPRSLCRRTDLFLLDLSKNRLTEKKIPKCLANLQMLQGMKFSSNKKSGVIPKSIVLFSSSLLGLKLNDNMFRGELPGEWGNLKGLMVLDFGDDKFFGNIPERIGEKLPYLMVLRLRGNNFTGGIPRSVCNVSELQILDVAFKNLTGIIPYCLGRLSAMVYRSLDGSLTFVDAEYENVNQVVKGVDREYTTAWQIMFNMDHSSNNLVGGIPVELTALSMLMGLKLSNNHLSGLIPESIGNMTKLESLDFSKNELTGIIPPSMASLNFLSRLNLSHNNLFGEIPTGNQLQTLDDLSIYIGNKDLCGAPLPKNYSSHEDPTTHEKKDETPDGPTKVCLYLDIIFGFAIGFSGVIGVLLFKKQWRQKLFMFSEETMNKIYVDVVVRVAKIKRGREAL
ncbi:receptor-like protein EIX2 [Lactuca sativa]|uniref:receptor-like protein EIX2 n=1 Tax=Lactuca sativa TaxID=4236 RepID=UPI000CD893B3|nr:receptor-like protein EIX2 [Lactuca sativa]